MLEEFFLFLDFYSFLNIYQFNLSKIYIENYIDLKLIKIKK